MSAGVWFWLIFVIALIFGGLGYFGVWVHGFAGMGLVVCVLFFLLGWKVFGSPIQ